MHVQPYLSFDGRCDEAIEFYKSALDAKVEFLMRFKDVPESSENPKSLPALAEKVMHSTLSIGDSQVNLSDGRCQGKPNFAGITLSLAASSEAEVDRLFAGLSDGGKVTMPPTKTFFSPRFGMVTDRFGVSWIVLVHSNRA